MNTDNLTLWSGLQAKGVVVTQVFLRGERQLVNVLDGLNVIRSDVQLLQFVTIKGNIVVDVLHDFVQALALERAHLVAAHTLFVRIPNHCLNSSVG